MDTAGESRQDVANPHLEAVLFLQGRVGLPDGWCVGEDGGFRVDPVAVHTTSGVTSGYARSRRVAQPFHFSGVVRREGEIATAGMGEPDRCFNAFSGLAESRETDVLFGCERVVHGGVIVAKGGP